MLSKIKAATPLPIRRALRRLAGEKPPTQRAQMVEPATAGALGCQIAYNELGAYCVPLASSERPSAQRVLRGGVWEPETLALVAAECGTGDIVHAGTYFGDFLPAYSRALAGEARAWAFEPNPENHRCAEITILLNRLENVALTNAGLGETSSVGRLKVLDSEGVALGGGSRLVADGADVSTTRDVTIVRIDDVVPGDRDVAVVQLDVEGFEDEALLGARETLTRCKPLLILERAPRQEHLVEFLSSLGYHEVQRVHVNTVLRAEVASTG